MDTDNNEGLGVGRIQMKGVNGLKKKGDMCNIFKNKDLKKKREKEHFFFLSRSHSPTSTYTSLSQNLVILPYLIAKMQKYRVLLDILLLLTKVKIY